MTAPSRAMVLSAGLGLRMRPITESLPKPLVEVAGVTMIDRCLDSLARAGVEKAVVNIHHLGHLMRAHLARHGGWIAISDETDLLLDTAGGIVRALPELGAEPFYVVNADSFWIDDGEPALKRLALAWDDRRMDILIMLARLDRATGHGDRPDFTIDPEGRLARAKGGADGHIYACAAILHPRIFAHAPEGPHSLNLHFDRAIAAGRMFGQVLEGHWFTVGTPAAIGEAEAALAGLRGTSG